MEQGELSDTQKEELKIGKIPMREALIKIRDRVVSFLSKYENVVILVEGAWGTGKTTLVDALREGIAEIPADRIVAIGIETSEIFGDVDFYKKILDDQAKSRARGKNLIAALYPEGNSPDVLIIDGESAGRILVDEVGIDRSNVIRINLCPDNKTRWNNLYNRGYRVQKIIKVMKESPIEINPDADFNIDNSLKYRLEMEEMKKILRG